jgi:hypothetical protein
VEEYTLLICVTLPEAAKATQGGETRVEVSPGHDVLSKATTTPGSALLFRKVHTAEKSIYEAWKRLGSSPVVGSLC